jgi:hypothetical protein
MMMMSLSHRETKLLAALLGVGVLVGGYMVLIRKEWSQWVDLSSKGGETGTLVKQLEAKEQELTQNLAKYEVLSEETRKKIAYTFEDKDLETRMKSFMDKLTYLSQATGNQLVTIHPYSPDEEGMQALQRNSQQQAGNGETPASPQEVKVPAGLRRFKAVKEDGIPLYSTEMEIKIRGSFPNVQRFVQGLTSLRSDLVKVQTLYISYEGLENPVIPMGQSSNTNSTVAHRTPGHPVLLSTRLKFYLLEPGRMDLSTLAQTDLAQQVKSPQASTKQDKPETTVAPRKNRIVYKDKPTASK